MFYLTLNLTLLHACFINTSDPVADIVVCAWTGSTVRSPERTKTLTASGM